MVKNQGTKQREQRSPGDCCHWKANGQCSKGDNCSFRHEMNKRAKIDTAESFSKTFYAAECEKVLDCRARIICEKWHSPECLFYRSENGFRFEEKCSSAHRQVDEQPSKNCEKNGDKSAVAKLKNYTTIGLRVSRYGAAESLQRSSNILKPIRCVRFTRAVLRHANIRDQNPSRLECFV